MLFDPKRASAPSFAFVAIPVLAGVVAMAACNRPEAPEAAASDEDSWVEPTPEPVAEVVVPEPEPTPPEPPPVVEHEVQPGDTFWGLAMESGCTVQQIQQASGIDSDIIYPGQMLRIPPCRHEGAAEAAAAGAPQGTPRPDIAMAGEYTVRPGDFLERIAQENGCSVTEIMVANEMRNDTIYAGRTLQIPECSGEDVPVQNAEQEVPENGYRVRPGDYLFGIAAQHGCSLNEVMRANSLTSDFIQAGRILTIPTDCTGESGGPAIISAVNTDRLPELMRQRAFSPPREFMALVVEITFDSARTRVVRERRFDWRGSSDNASGWNPASAIKIFAGVAAMQRARDLGFTGEALITFHGGTEVTHSLNELVGAALGPSDNIAYNRLVQFVGYDNLNSQFFSRRNGMSHSALRRPYERSRWMGMGEPSSFSETPRITVREGGRTRTIDAASGSAATACGGAACTTLQDLSECMRRLMLQEQLPAADSFDLPRADLLTVRRTLRTDRDRGDEVVDALARDFPIGTVFYHKAGFAGDWYSDNVYIFDPTQGRAFIVTMAGYPGRSSLNRAAAIIGDILAAGEL